jgi:hypothetical protein
MMDFHVDGELTVLQSLDQVRFPEGPAAIKQRGVEPRHQREQLSVSSRLRECQVLSVVLEVQVRIVLPVERSEPPEGTVSHAVREGLPKLAG